MKQEEKIYSCEVKKLFLRNGRKSWLWVERPVVTAIQDGVTEFRCKDCHGAVKLHRKHIDDGPAPHAEHRSREDSEYCPAGKYFLENPGREPRMSAAPVK